MTTSKSVAVFGATGFIGAAVVRALHVRGAVVLPMTTPRLTPTSADHAEEALQGLAEAIAGLASQLVKAECVINAAGVAEAASGDEGSLTAANIMVPGYLAMAASTADVPRFVQVSSAAVQGRTRLLDSSSSMAPFSPYSQSKALGELLARKAHPGTVAYRPPGVHGPGRRVTQMTARIARSSISSVAQPGSSPTPQALLTNVADAIAFLALSEAQPPAIVAHPCEGLTTATVLTFLGGHKPIVIPRPMAKALVALLAAGGKAMPQLAANARRVEMLWFGQSQAPSWLTEAGWSPPAGHDAWEELGRMLADSSASPE